MTIEFNPLFGVMTIVFLNKTHHEPTPTVWVCPSKDAYDQNLAHLQTMSHIEIVQIGPSLVTDAV